MKVILKQDVKGSGKSGDLVEVSDGYANNFLIKKGLAVVANSNNLNQKIAKDNALAHHEKMELQNAEDMAKKLDGKSISICAKAGANGKLFGSVTAKEIATELKKTYNIDVNKRKITLSSDIKNFGTFSFELKLHTKVSVTMHIIVKEQV